MKFNESKVNSAVSSLNGVKAKINSAASTIDGIQIPEGFKNGGSLKALPGKLRASVSGIGNIGTSLKNLGGQIKSAENNNLSTILALVTMGLKGEGNNPLDRSTNADEKNNNGSKELNLKDVKEIKDFAYITGGKIGKTVKSLFTSFGDFILKTGAKSVAFGSSMDMSLEGEGQITSHSGGGLFGGSDKIIDIDEGLELDNYAIDKAFELIRNGQKSDAFALLDNSNGMSEETKKYTEQRLKDIELDVALEFLSLGTGKSGIDQGIFRELELTDPAYYNELEDKFCQDHKMSIIDAKKLMNSIDTVGVCTYADSCNALFEYARKNPEGFTTMFGIPAYRICDNGLMGINDGELLLDMYYTINHNDNGGNIIYSNGESNYIPEYLNEDNLASYQKNVNLEGTVDMLGDYTYIKTGRNMVSEFSAKAYNEGEFPHDVVEMNNIVQEQQAQGKHVSLGYSSDSGYSLELKGDGLWDSYALSEPHIMSVVRTGADGFVVNTFGKDYLVDNSELEKDGVTFYIGSYRIE